VTSATVLGDALLDVVVRPTVAIRPGADVPAEIRVGAGGQGANLAVRLARQGIDTDLVCGLGDDPPAAIVGRALRAEGVRLQAVTVDATGSVVILLDDAGERTMLSHRPPFAAPAAARLAEYADWVVVSGYLLCEEAGLDLARSLATHGGRRVLVGCAVPPDPAAWRRAAEALAPVLTVLNRDEAAALDASPGFAGGGLVVTDASGAVATIGDVSVESRIGSVAPALDTTGAGDAFSAALVASLASTEWPPAANALERALDAANELGSAVARTPGAQGRVGLERAAPISS
jgi:sugar/nucleoside kinase (ribokinase family)